MTDESYIKLAIEIAKKGSGKVSPNPLVGCLIVKDDRIIGAGYHSKYGENHAEINALKSSKENVEGSTMYVNLEPCSHFGKTPPCVEKIIENKIKRVVVGTLDVNPLVSGNGIKTLKSAGIEVKVGILEDECTELNKFFFKFITKKSPYVTLKIAQTLDGKIADVNYESKWITSTGARKYVHILRSKYDAVLVGSGTVANDDPVLTVRLAEGRNPKRVILDTNLKLKLNHKIFSYNSDHNLLVLTSKNSISKKRKINKLLAKGAEIIFVRENSDGKINLKAALKELARVNVTSVLVEGGNAVFSSFLSENLFDDILCFTAPKILGDGLPVFSGLGISNVRRAVKLKIRNVEKVGDDVLLELVR